MTARTQGAHHVGLTVIPSITGKIVGRIAIVGLLAVTGSVIVNSQLARAANPERGLKWTNEGELISPEDYHRPVECLSGVESRSIDLRAAIFWHRSVVTSGAWPWGALSTSHNWLLPAPDASALRPNPRRAPRDPMLASRPPDPRCGPSP